LPVNLFNIAQKSYQLTHFTKAPAAPNAAKIKVVRTILEFDSDVSTLVLLHSFFAIAPVKNKGLL
jgi:hypothetical protein